MYITNFLYKIDIFLYISNILILDIAEGNVRKHFNNSCNMVGMVKYIIRILVIHFIFLSVYISVFFFNL